MFTREASPSCPRPSQQESSGFPCNYGKRAVRVEDHWGSASMEMKRARPSPWTASYFVRSSFLSISPDFKFSSTILLLVQCDQKPLPSSSASCPPSIFSRDSSLSSYPSAISLSPPMQLELLNKRFKRWNSRICAPRALVSRNLFLPWFARRNWRDYERCYSSRRWWTNSRPPPQVCFADGGPRFHVIETPGNTATSPTLSDSCAPRRNVAALNAKLVPPEKEERKEGRKENCGRINRSLLLGNFPSDFRNDLGL